LRGGTIPAAGRAREENHAKKKRRKREDDKQTRLIPAGRLSMLEPSSEKKKRRKGGTVTLLAGYRSMVLLACFPAAERAICMHACPRAARMQSRTTTSLAFHVLNVINEVVNIHLGISIVKGVFGSLCHHRLSFSPYTSSPHTN
jgi:hypothetical protein